MICCAAPGTSCIADALPLTENWPEPLCAAHYAVAARCPPRTILEYTDGHREMRNNFVYGRIYKDVVTEFDAYSGKLIPVRKAWFEQAWIHRAENGKPVMLCYAQIPEPTPALVTATNISSASTALQKRKSGWRQWIRKLAIIVSGFWRAAV